MIEVFKIREVQLGFIILLASFFSLLLSGADVNMTLTHALIITISCILLIVFTLHVIIMLTVPMQNDLVRVRNSSRYIRTFQATFLFIYFDITTIIIGLISGAVGNERGYNILLLSMFMTNLYNLLTNTMILFNLIRLSEKKNN